MQKSGLPGRKTRGRCAGLRPAMVLMSALAAACTGSGDIAETPSGKYYLAAGGRVDRATYTGWQIFRENCSRCHGADAAGTESGPDLLQRIGRLSIEEFRIKVLERYFVSMPLQEALSESGASIREAMQEQIAEQESGEYADVRMPPWRDNPDVRDHIHELYGYLTARADGILAPGVPELLRE
jgi:hypothetical protein